MALVFGDLHGCSRALKTLWMNIDPEAQQEVIFLGDYMDRGNNSAAVIDFLINIKKTFKNAKFLMGNHEEMVLDCRYGGDYWFNWLKYGGDATLESYGIDPSLQELSKIPSAHWDFLSRLLPYYENDQYIFSHACINMRKPLVKQNSDELRWWGNLSDDSHVSGKPVFFGHMSQRRGKPKRFGQNICVDTSVSGWVSCFDTETNLVHQSNHEGDYQFFTLEN